MSLDRNCLNIADWAGSFDERTLLRGISYAKQGMTRVIHVSPTLIDSRCHGGAERPYRQQISLRSANDYQWLVNGRCSCPVAHNCKHVVAALLTLRQLQDKQDPIATARVKLDEQPLQQRDDLSPVARLTLGSHQRLLYDKRSQKMLEQTQHRAALAFIYGRAIANSRFGNQIKGRNSQGQSVIIQRQLTVEQAFRNRLLDLGMRPALRRSDALPEQAGEPYEFKESNRWLNFIEHDLPSLRAQGWRVEIAENFHFQFHTVQNWYAKLHEEPEQGWFDLELGIVVEGKRVSLLPILLHCLRNTPWLLDPEQLAQRPAEELLLIERPNGEGRIALPYGRVRTLMQSLGELYLEPNQNSEQLRLSRADASRLANLQQLPAQWDGAERLRELAVRLQQPSHELAAPAGLNAELRDYQRQGVSWMQTLAELGLGGVLADDMGLGKTLQTLAHLLLEKQQGRLRAPALIVMPTSLLGNWQQEAARFTPDLRVLTLHGSERRKRFAQIAEHDLILTSYALLSRDIHKLTEQMFSVLILDEAQAIKNPRSKVSQAASSLRARQRLCLSGTPLENHLGELWALFNFLMPGWLGSETEFNQQYRTPIERQADSLRLAHLHTRVRPLMLRRRKDEVARELPPKSEFIHWVELSDAQRDRYESLRLSMDDKLRTHIRQQGLSSSRLLILEVLLRLRQTCCDLRLLDGPDSTASASQSAKLVSLMVMLDKLLTEGRRVLVFSQFSQMLDLIAAELAKKRIRYALLTGATRDRQAQIESFQEGDLPVFLISLKAGGAGLNLTAADTVIHFDPWWNPASEAQASDRAYRIGQDKPVFVYRLIAKGSIEEKIQHLQQSKADLAAGVLEGNASAWSLELTDLEQLLAPLAPSL